MPNSAHNNVLDALKAINKRRCPEGDQQEAACASASRTRVRPLECRPAVIAVRGALRVVVAGAGAGDV
jgi:hypothetical protein